MQRKQIWKVENGSLFSNFFETTGLCEWEYFNQRFGREHFYVEFLTTPFGLKEFMTIEAEGGP